MFKNLNTKSRIYLIGMAVCIITLFLLTAVVFLWVTADKLDIVFSQKPGITYTYFISIMDRILAILGIFVILPLTLYQIIEKNKSAQDRIISGFSILVILISMGILIFLKAKGEKLFFFRSYKEGELSHSVMFCSQPEFEIFNKILTENKQEIPQTCLPPTFDK